MDNLEGFINEKFDMRAEIKPGKGSTELKNAIKNIIQKLDDGQLRIA